MDDLLEEFIAETRDTIEVLSGQLIEWERNPQDHALIDSVFRFVHTVKGSCGFLDLPRLLRLSHAAEDLLSGARDGIVGASPQLVTAVLAVIDQIAILTDALETGRAVHDNDADLIEAMLAFIPKQGQSQKLVHENTIAGSIEPNEFDEFEGIVGRAKSRSVRVSLSLLDKLMNGVSDMVLTRNEVSRQLRKNGANAELDHSFTRLSSSVAEMRDAVSLMRMQNIDRLFSSLPRLLRDIEQELGKPLELQIEGSEVEVDREMVEALRDPLTHILRNAADHGIESADARLAAGKARVGLIRISARQSGNQIMVEISDDGQGIDIEKLGVRAIAAQLISAADWQKLSEKAKLRMIFTPGLSTANHISAISGRGVGMDVVRNNIQEVGGTIDLENFPGLGLKMTLRLPLTLSIIAGLSVRAGDQMFGISRNSVVEILSISNANVQIEQIGSKQVACVRGERMPYAKLEQLLDIAETKAENDTSRTLIVIRPAVGTTYVLDVAGVLDNEELVVKPGAPIVMANGLYAGTSLPDNGRPILLLDASGIAGAIGIDQKELDIANRHLVDEAEDETRVKRQSALLFISIDGRKQAIRLSVIDRMEDVDAAHISYVGGRWRVIKDGELVDLFGLAQPPKTGLIKALRLSDGQSSKYLAVDDVLDIFSIDGEITPSAQPELHEGIVHAFDEAIELVNVFQYFEVSGNIRAAGTNKPLCFIECSEDAQWERRILAPLLVASGYEVSFDPQDHAQAGIVLSRDTENRKLESNDGRLLRLRDDSHAVDNSVPSIYRYDRLGLLSAIEQKLSGVA
jgi:two-component system, chemotaxis family, sensor kinase CheA